MREALTSSRSFFDCPFLFAPTGVDLTLHTHTALPAFIGATLLRSLSPAAALNVTIIGSIFLAGLCTYLLAWRVTHDRISSVLSGVVFAGSPYMAARLTGHFNLTHTWVIPLFAIVASEGIRRGRVWLGVGAGVIAGLTAYIDYYYVVYQAVLIGIFVILEMRDWRVSIRGSSETTPLLRRAVAIAMVLVAGLVIAIVVSGGFELSFGQLRLSARTVYNPLQIFWVLVALWLWLRFRPAVSGGMNPEFNGGASMRLLAGAAIGFLVVASPLVIRGVGLLKNGEYVTHRYTWRSGPDGIDASTLITGNPFHPVWGDSGPSVTGVARYQRRRIVRVAWRCRPVSRRMGAGPSTQRSGRASLGSCRHSIFHLGARPAPDDLRRQYRPAIANSCSPVSADRVERPDAGSSDRCGLSRACRAQRRGSFEVASGEHSPKGGGVDLCACRFRRGADSNDRASGFNAGRRSERSPRAGSGL